MDIAIAWDTVNNRGDWFVQNGSLAIDQGGLQSAVLVSLFTDARAPSDVTLPDGSNDPRGHWSDTYEAEPLGSLLWLLARAKKAGNNNAATYSYGSSSPAGSLLLRAEDYCKSALKWLLDDKVAKSVSVSARWITRTAMGIKIVITKPAGNAETFDFAWAWSGIG